VEEALERGRKRAHDARNSFRENLGLPTATTTTASTITASTTTTLTSSHQLEDEYYLLPEPTNSTAGAMEELKNFNAKKLYQLYIFRLPIKLLIRLNFFQLVRLRH